MGLFDQLNELTNSASSAGNMFKSVASNANFIYPTELQNLEKTDSNIQQKITELQSSLPSSDNPINNTNTLVQLRIFLTSHYTNLLVGGEPAPDAIKKVSILANPKYAAVKSRYNVLSSQLAALEKQFGGYLYGYQNANGSITAPDISWTTEQLEQAKAQSLEQAAKCWLISNPKQSIA